MSLPTVVVQHQFWWYWCIGPNDPLAMNTFVERPAIQARLLYWLTALHAVNGMLYYDVAIWSDQCPSQRPCSPVGRINNTGLTDFNPATWYVALCISQHRMNT
jgi:hypothetical protein